MGADSGVLPGGDGCEQSPANRQYPTCALVVAEQFAHRGRIGLLAPRFGEVAHQGLPGEYGMQGKEGREAHG